MAQQLYKATHEFSAKNLGSDKPRNFKEGDEFWADSGQDEDIIIFRVDNYIEFEVDAATFKRSTQLKNG
jgi:hypothetical protein